MRQYGQISYGKQQIPPPPPIPNSCRLFSLLAPLDIRLEIYICMHVCVGQYGQVTQGKQQMSTPVPLHAVQLTLPSQVAAASSAASVLVGSGSLGSSGGAGGGGGGDAERGDGGLLAKKVARQIAERKKREEVPFQTKAMREIERLQKATVYRTTIIKVRQPQQQQPFFFFPIFFFFSRNLFVRVTCKVTGDAGRWLLLSCFIDMHNSIQTTHTTRRSLKLTEALENGFSSTCDALY